MIFHLPQRFIFSLVVLIAITLALWVAPDILAIYYQNQAGELLASAQKDAGIDPNSWDLSPLPLENAKYISQLAQSISYLQRSLEYNAGDSHSYLLLGQAFLMQGLPERAVRAYEEYVRLRPANPLGHLQLALANEQVWKRSANLLYDDLTLELPLAQVQTLAPMGDISLCKISPLPEQCDVVTTVQKISGSEKDLLVHYPPSKITYRLTLPSTPAILRLSPALLHSGTDVSSQIVEFTVLVQATSGGQSEKLYQTYLGTNSALGDEVRLDLSKYAGMTIGLTLATEPIGATEHERAQAAWVAPVIQSVDAIQYGDEDQLSKASMRREWEQTGFTAQDFLRMAEELCKADSCLDSIPLIQRALILEPRYSFDTRAGEALGIPCSIPAAAERVKMCRQYMEQPRRNLFVNSRFDFGRFGWDNLQLDDSQFQVVPCQDESRAGNCASIESRHSGYHGGWYQVFQLEPGKRYRYSLWLKTESFDALNGGLLYAQVTKDGQAVGIGGIDFQGSTEWSYRETLLTVLPSDDGFIQVYPVLMKNSGRVWITDIKLVAVDDSVDH